MNLIGPFDPKQPKHANQVYVIQAQQVLLFFL